MLGALRAAHPLPGATERDQFGGNPSARACCCAGDAVLRLGPSAWALFAIGGEKLTQQLGSRALPSLLTLMGVAKVLERVFDICVRGLLLLVDAASQTCSCRI